MIKDINRKYQKVLGLWESMQDNLTFSYQHAFSDAMFNSSNREENEMLWNKIDEEIVDVMTTIFPYSIKIECKEVIETDRYVLFEYSDDPDGKIMRFTKAITNAKRELKQSIDAYNAISPDKINNAGDIERMLKIEEEEDNEEDIQEDNDIRFTPYQQDAAKKIQRVGRSFTQRRRREARMQSMIKDINRKYQKVLGLWESMQDNTTFSYKNSRSDEEFSNRNREENEILWKKVDEDIGDVMKTEFPLVIDLKTGEHFLDMQPAEKIKRFTTAITNAKRELKQNIDAYNEISTDKINNAGDIERILNDPIVATEENTVVILVNCHGGYVVNSDLTIAKIPAPENKLVEIVKRAPFGFLALSDFNYSSRFPKGENSTRYSTKVIREKLVAAYKKALKNITILSNPTQYRSRNRSSHDMDQDPEGTCKRFGPFDESCTHVGFEYSQVPFLRKVYQLDDISSYQREEFFRGIIFMFKDLEGNYVQYNINRKSDLKFLINHGYIQRTGNFDLLMTRTIGYDANGNLNEGNLITHLLTDFLLEIINCFQDKYTIFKIVDDSCGGFDKALTAAQRDIIYQRYRADMQCSAPLKAKGGFKKTRKRKNKFRKGRKRN